MSLTLTRIDPLILGDHYYLTADDECYFLREYTARGGFDASETNQIIQNIKKSPDRRGRQEWFYEERDIKRAASELRAALNPTWLRSATIVPVPPHVVKGDPLHDDRVLQMATLLGAGAQIDVRELVVQLATTPPSHQSASRPRPFELRANYRLGISLCTYAGEDRCARRFGDRRRTLSRDQGDAFGPVSDSRGDRHLLRETHCCAR